MQRFGNVRLDVAIKFDLDTEVLIFLINSTGLGNQALIQEFDPGSD